MDSSEIRQRLLLHEKSYPHGQLVRAREILWIRLALREGRKDEAASRATSLLATQGRNPLSTGLTEGALTAILIQAVSPKEPTHDSPKHPM